MLDKDDVSKLTTAVTDLREVFREFKDSRTSHQVVQQYNAGGTAMWVVVVMAAVIFTAAITQGPRITELERKLDRQQDYLNNIYQQAPWLKPKEEDVNDNHHNDSAKK